MKLDDQATAMENTFVTFHCYFRFCNLLFLVIFWFCAVILLFFVVHVN